MNLLPSEIVHRILEYDGRIKYRNGKYMNQIDPDDYRYHLLRKIPVFQRDDWYTGNFYVYRIHYNDYENHNMVVYIFDESITYLYTGKENDGYINIR
jgi:hypothetical protein